MKKLCFTLLAFLLLAFSASADGGMWLMQQMAEKYQAMKAAGLELEAYDVYNPSGASLKDAVVMFDGGCTGAVVSDRGLILTNHHCGYDQIQAHSSLDKNYLQDGFWAANLGDELANPGLEVTFIDEITDVTAAVKKELAKIKDPLSMDYLSPKYLSGIAPRIIGKKKTTEPGVEYLIKAFYGGNLYLMFKQIIYRDVRLVGAPPSSIGKFGEDTDNWAWPRHSGDFSIFRIYTDKNGRPAEYAPGNIPLKPKRHFKVSTKGISENEYAMIMGFPGTTYHFFTPAEVEEWGTIDNDIRIRMRDIRQRVMLEAMLADPQIKIMYAAKYAGSQNGYKRAQGANWAITKRGLIDIKRAQCNTLLNWAKQRNEGLYAEAVDDIARLVGERCELRTRLKYIEEAGIAGSEFIYCPIPSDEVLKNLRHGGAIAEKAVRELRKSFEVFFNKDYSPALEMRIAKAVWTEYCKRIAPEHWPQALRAGTTAQNGDVTAYIDRVFASSAFQSKESFTKVCALSSADLADAWQKDEMVTLSASIISEYRKLIEDLKPFDAPLSRARQTYIAGMIAAGSPSEVWPDANLTLRFTYGKMKGYAPRDDVYYGPQTTLTGVMEKEDPDNWEYNVSPRLKELYEKKDFGSYALQNGKMPVNFCANTHTTGGNSGSPVLNARGELIGLNFDRNWEGVGGDIEFLPDYQRSIICDIRYLLFIVDKYAGSDRLIKEMLGQ